jgi:hypothetical protein
MKNAPDKIDRVFINIFVLLAVFWTLCVLQSVVGTCTKVIDQSRTKRFVVTVGQVLQSQPVEQTRSKGSKTYVVYDLKFEYAYNVNGRHFISNRIRYGNVPSENRAWSETFARTFTAGTNLNVFYNPNNPTESVISAGIRGSDIVSFWVAGAFTAVTVLIWRMLFVQKKVHSRPLSILRISDTSPNGRTVVRLVQYPPSVLALIPFIVMCFVADMVTNVLFGPEPSLSSVLWISSAIIFVTIAIFLQRWVRLKRGDENLVIDGTAGTLTLPKTFGRKRLVTIPIPQIKSVELREIRGKNYYRCEPTLQFSGAPIADAVLAAWPNRFQGEAFVDWLSNRLGLPSRRTDQVAKN